MYADLLTVVLLSIILWLLVNRETSGYVSDGDTLLPGSALTPDRALTSQNGWYKAVMQTDGKFVIYNGSNAKIWEKSSNSPNSRLVNNSGNLLIRGSDGSIKLDLGTSQGRTYSNAKVIMKNNGNLTVVGNINGQERVIWSSQTQGK